VRAAEDRVADRGAEARVGAARDAKSEHLERELAQHRLHRAREVAERELAGREEVFERVLDGLERLRDELRVHLGVALELIKVVVPVTCELIGPVLLGSGELLLDLFLRLLRKLLPLVSHLVDVALDRLHGPARCEVDAELRPLHLLHVARVLFGGAPRLFLLLLLLLPLLLGPEQMDGLCPWIDPERTGGHRLDEQRHGSSERRPQAVDGVRDDIDRRLCAKRLHALPLVDERVERLRKVEIRDLVSLDGRRGVELIRDEGLIWLALTFAKLLPNVSLTISIAAAMRSFIETLALAVCSSAVRSASLYSAPAPFAVSKATLSDPFHCSKVCCCLPNA
jgi:hypothetical protein